MVLETKDLLPPTRRLLSGASLFLDFDGTLVEIAARHDAVRVEDRVHRLMTALEQCLGGRVAIVSGRSAGEVRALFGSSAFAIGGSHGLEMHWSDGRVSLNTTHNVEEIPSVKLADLVQRFPGVIVERKPFGVALHYRLAPEAEAACRQRAAELADALGFTVQTGKMVVELKAVGADKGRAVEAFMGAAPMSGGVPVFVGDDETDEAGFAAAAKLGGAGVLVGAQRESQALYRIGSVEETLQWLEEACEAQP